MDRVEGVPGASWGDVTALSHARELATFTRCVYSAETIDALLDGLFTVAGRVLRADAIHVGQVDHSHGRMRILRSAGSLASQRTAHAMSVPLVSAGGVWGELSVTRVGAEPFSEDDAAMATVVAGLAGMGLVRVLDDQRLRELAYTDALTGLANRRAADEQLEAWAEDLNHARQLSVILCDVNGLKTVNDTHGHVVGDRLIHEAAGLVSAAAGRLPQGFAARMGGDEFVIASPCPDQGLVAQVVEQLTEAAARLPYGSGLSCGSAWCGDLVRPEPSPRALVHSLLRIADAEQYRRKLVARTGLADAGPPAAQPGAARTGKRAHRDLPTAASSTYAGHDRDRAGATAPSQAAEWVRATDRGASVQDRLARGAHTICEHAGGVAWWVSAVDLAGGTLQAVSCGTTRPPEITDGLWPPVEVDPTVYLLGDFPTTERAVRHQDAFYIDSLTGDASERRLLMQTGYQSMIAAGGTDSGGGGWLVEIYGDSLTGHLREFTSTLNAMTADALLPSRGPSGRTAVGTG